MGEPLIRCHPRGLLAANPGLVDHLRAVPLLDLRHLAFHWVAADGAVSRIDVTVSAPRPGREPSLDVVLLDPAPHGLTGRELQVLTLVACGLTNPDIAARLGVARRTVATHVERTLTKLAAPTRTAATALAVEHGLLALPLPDDRSGLARLAVVRLAALVSGVPRRLSRRVARPRPLVIGSVYPGNSESSSDRHHMRCGTELALAELNDRGGVDGRPIVHLPIEADARSATAVKAALASLVEHEVDAITFGHHFSREGLDTILTDVAEYGAPLVHSITSDSARTLVETSSTRFGNVFQVCAPETRYGTGFIRTLTDLTTAGQWRPDSRRIVVADTDHPQFTTFTEPAHRAAEQDGWQVCSVERVDFLRPDWTGVLDAVQRYEPAALMVAAFTRPGLVDLLRRFAAHPRPPLLYALYAPSLSGFLEEAGSSAEGLLWATVIGRYDDRFGAGFAERFRARNGCEPDRVGAGVHYDMAHLLAGAWRDGTDVHDFREVAARLRSRVWRGVSGAYFLGERGQSGLTYPDDTPDASIAQAHLVHQVQNGRHRLIRPAGYATSDFRSFS